jgi:endonuclease/exonuclease/phosphatase family metal-dependent hydrolase
LLLISGPLGLAEEAPLDPAGPSLKILTINVWSGLDYEGTFKMGEWETGKRRRARFDALVAQAKELSPDVVFVQEANPAGRYAQRLGRALGMTQIHKVVNGGIKLGPVGIPTNLKEGMAILAKPALRLRRRAAWKLSGPLGLFGDLLTFHFSEAIFSIVGEIRIGSAPLSLVNVHLVASPSADEEVLGELRDLPDGKALTDKDFGKAVEEVKARDARRRAEVERLLGHLRDLPENAPVIVAGDFNAGLDSPEMILFAEKFGGFEALDAAERRSGGANPSFSWHFGANENVLYSAWPANASGKKRTGYALLDALDATIPRRIDFIFLGRRFREDDVLAARIAIDEAVNGVHASDHFGVFAEISLKRLAPAVR